MESETVLRISQLDSLELDEEILEMLWSQLSNCARHFSANTLYTIKPEVMALLRLLLWRYSVLATGATFGQQMLGLTYSQSYNSSSSASRATRIMLVGLQILADWVQERWGALLPWLSEEKGAVLCKIMSYIELLLKILTLLNFINFLLHGRYPALLQRLLNLRMSHTRKQISQTPVFAYMNREILWHGFTEFIFTVLPLVNVSRLCRWCRDVVMKCGIQLPRPAVDNCCPVCNSVPCMPHLPDCGHVHCYYCLKSNVLADERFQCGICNLPVTQCIPVGIT